MVSLPFLILFGVNFRRGRRRLDASLLGNAGLLDDLGPALDVARHALAHGLGRAALGVQAELARLLPQVGVGQRRDDVAVENGEDVLRQAGGADNAFQLVTT